MAHSQSLAAYADVEAVLDTILRHDKWPAYLTLETRKEATHWRFRASAFRSVLRKREEERLGLPPGEGSSRYDNFILRVEGTTVVFEKRTTPGVLVLGGDAHEAVSDRVLLAEYEGETSTDD